jgi:beta-phosphoglucomutase-like phosphatase (HAD superfamily)
MPRRLRGATLHAMTIASPARPTRRPRSRPRLPAHAIDTERPANEALSLEAVGARWRTALDAADSALWAAAPSLRGDELRGRRGRLAGERASTVELLERAARTEGVPGGFSHLLVSRSNLRRLLALPSRVTACVFNLDGVLLGSAAVHAAAWTETFDEFIIARIERTGGRFAPFNPHVDYPRHIHARPRLEGVRAFLASRGISLPEGDPGDPPGAETVHGLASRKRQALLRRLDEQGLRAFDGSKRYLELARDAGIGCAVVSASATTGTILERASLSHLISARVDGDTIVSEALRPRPAPDILLAACRLLDVAPGRAAAFETSAAGVVAARAAGFELVVGVDAAGHAAPFLDEGADLVTTGLHELLERSAPHGARVRL